MRRAARVRSERDDALSQLNLARSLKFGRQTIDLGFGMFNVFNTGAHTQWDTGANRLNNSLYCRGSIATPRRSN